MLDAIDNLLAFTLCTGKTALGTGIGGGKTALGSGICGGKTTLGGDYTTRGTARGTTRERTGEAYTRGTD